MNSSPIIQAPRSNRDPPHVSVFLHTRSQNSTSSFSNFPIYHTEPPSEILKLSAVNYSRTKTKAFKKSAF